MEDGDALDISLLAVSGAEAFAMVKLARALGKWRSVWWDRSVVPSHEQARFERILGEEFGRVTVCGLTGFLHFDAK